MNLNKIFIILLITVFVLCGIAAADKLSGGGYTLYDSINSGGASLQGGGYALKDVKGEVLGGQMNGGGYSFWPGLYGLLVGGVIEVPGVPYGTVPLYIRRNVSNIEITWEAKYVNPKIYAISGGGRGEYTSIYSTQWLPVTEAGAIKTGLPVPLGTFKAAPNTNILTHEVQLGSGTTECYYKGFQAPIANPTTATDPKTSLPIFPQAWAVGKANAVFYKTAASGWNFISSPLLLGGLDQVLGIDYTNGDQVWVWDDANQKFIAPITFDGSTWGNNNFNPGFGCLLNLTANSPKVTTMIGNVNTKALDRPINFKAGTPSYGWNLIGNPHATLDTSMTGFAAGKSVNGDSLWEWDNAGQKFLAPLTFDGTKWPGGTQLKTMKAYGYNFTGTNAFTWQVPAQ